MLHKSPGQILCAHCSANGAETACRACTRLVCAACAADVDTCDTPVTREIRLGTGARLRAVDPAGDFGVVSKWYGVHRLYDLRAEEFLDDELPSTQHKSLLLPGGRAIVPLMFSPTMILESSGFAFSEAPEGERRIARVVDRAAAPMGSFRVKHFGVCRRREWAFSLLSSEEILFFDVPSRRTLRLEPLSNAVVQAASIDDNDCLLASATYGRVRLHQFDPESGELERTGWVTISDADIVQVYLEARRLAVLANFRGTRGYELRVYRLDEKLVPEKEPSFNWIENASGTSLEMPVHIDLSPDGRFLATALVDKRVLIYDLHLRTTQIASGHSDQICLVRFLNDGTLISADCDNRVFIRPRVGDRFTE